MIWVNATDWFSMLYYFRLTAMGAAAEHNAKKLLHAVPIAKNFWSIKKASQSIQLFFRSKTKK